MPQVVAGQEYCLFILVSQFRAVSLHIADGTEIDDLAGFPQGDMAFLRLSQCLGKGQLPVIIEWLVGEMQQ